MAGKGEPRVEARLQGIGEGSVVQAGADVHHGEQRVHCRDAPASVDHLLFKVAHAVQVDAVQVATPAVANHHLRALGRLVDHAPQPGSRAPVGGGTVTGGPDGAQQGLLGGAGRARDPIDAGPRGVETAGGEVAVEATDGDDPERLVAASEGVLALGDGE